MKFLEPRIQAEWESSALDPTVRRIVLEAAAYAAARWDWEFALTSIWRSPEEDRALGASGIHGEWRAVDVRTRDVPPEAIEDVARAINGRWIYDPERPHFLVCVSAPHGSGPHLHFQAHARTAPQKSEPQMARMNADDRTCEKRKNATDGGSGAAT